MDVPMLEYVVAQLQAKRGEWQTISAESGVPYFTLAKIVQGQVTNPRVRTVQTLYDYLSGTKRQTKRKRRA